MWKSNPLLLSVLKGQVSCRSQALAGVSKAVYKEDVDSIILASSDSDFKSLLWNNNIFYCYLDKFMTPEKDKFFDTVFKKNLKK